MPEQLSKHEAATLFMVYLEQRGAIFRIKPDGYLDANLDAVNSAAVVS